MNVDGASAGEVAAFLASRARVLVLTGAGCSTGSGIPAYRDESGAWQHQQPMRYQRFVSDPGARRKYWARSSVGYSRIRNAEPSPCHRALAGLEQLGQLSGVITQNVDGLHQRAGSQGVVDLHGRLDTVVCLACEARYSRDAFQGRLNDVNADFFSRLGARARATPAVKPDGDAALSAELLTGFQVPNCEQCGGLLKPDVVFFGENVPEARVEHCYAELARSDGLLVVGSSLMVFSGLRFARRAARDNKAICIVNRGITRGDALASVRASADCGDLLSETLAVLQGDSEAPGLSTDRRSASSSC